MCAHLVKLQVLGVMIPTHPTLIAATFILTDCDGVLPKCPILISLIPEIGIPMLRRSDVSLISTS